MVKEIIREANRKTRENKMILLSVFLFITMLELVRDFSIQLGILGVLFMLLFVAAEHGSVVAGLKITGQKAEPVDPQRDGLCGIRRIKELFSTYFEMDLVVYGLTLLVLWIISLIVFNRAFHDEWQSIFARIVSEKQYGISDTANQLINWLILVIAGVSLICDFIVNWMFFMAPYDLELYHLKGLQALKEAWKKGQGHRAEIFQLLLHYAWLALVFGCLDYLVLIYISNIFLSSIASMAILVLGLYCYKMEYAVAKAIMYQRLSQGKESNHEFINE